jgi:hypothetical protein
MEGFSLEVREMRQESTLRPDAANGTAREEILRAMGRPPVAPPYRSARCAVMNVAQDRKPQWAWSMRAAWRAPEAAALHPASSPRHRGSWCAVPRRCFGSAGPNAEEHRTICVPVSRTRRRTRALAMHYRPPSTNADRHRAEAGSRAAEPPSASEGTLDAAEHGGRIPSRWRGRDAPSPLNRERPRGRQLRA